MATELTIAEIEKFASRPGVRRVAVENFLITATNNKTLLYATLNLERDARMYNWNDETVAAIVDGLVQIFAGGER